MNSLEFQQELEKALFEAGVTGLFDRKIDEKVEEHFKKIGRIEEFKKFKASQEMHPSYQLKKPIIVGKDYDGKIIEVPFYEILEEEGITFDSKDYLRLDGERIALADEKIIPLKGKKEELRKVLKVIIDKKRELSYPDEVYELPSHADREDGWYNYEAKKWMYPEDFIQANKVAHDFGLFWKNIDKLKESSDPFVQALIHLDKLPEYNPQKELKQGQFEKELRKEQIKLELLKEIPYVKIQKNKQFGIIPRKQVELNPGYKEFFYNHLGSYSTEEVHQALKDLEKETKEDLRSKVRALRKEFEKKEGISRRKKLALAAGILAGGAIAAAGYMIYDYYFQDRTPPKINSVDYKFFLPNTISITVNTTDTSGIAEVLANVQGKNYSLPLVNSFYTGNITHGTISEIENLPIKIYAFDKFSNCAKKELTAVPTLKEKFLSLAIVNNMTQGDAENFYSNYFRLVQQLFPENKTLLLPPLKLHVQNSTIFNELYRNILQYPQVTIDKNKMLSLASQLFSDLGYTGKVKVLIPGTNEYREEFLSRQTIQTFGNYSIAINQLGLPKHDKATLFLLGNASLINSEMVDFEPILLKDMNGTIFVIKSKDIPRDCWMLVEHLKHTPYVVNYPEMYKAFSIKVQQNAFDILDYLDYVVDPHGLSEYEKNAADDKIIWDKVIIPQWEYYWGSTPQSGNLSRRICVFPWYNSTLLRQQIADETDRKIALMYFWELLPRVANLDEWKDDRVIVFHKGLDAMIYQVEQMPRIYKEVISKYPNVIWTNPITGIEHDYRVHYYAWINDRADHGLYNAGKQLLGADINEIPLYDYLKNIDDLMLQYDSINTYLSKNFTYWDLIKFIHGYGIEYGGGDSQMDLLYFPIAFKAFGVPYQLLHFGEHYIPSTKSACGDDGGILGLPDDVIKPLKEGLYGEALLLPGNCIDILGIGLEGLKKDLEYGKQNPIYPNLKYTEIFLPIRGYKIYFFKGGIKD